MFQSSSESSLEPESFPSVINLFAVVNVPPNTTVSDSDPLSSITIQQNVQSMTYNNMTDQEPLPSFEEYDTESDSDSTIGSRKEMQDSTSSSSSNTTDDERLPKRIRMARAKQQNYTSSGGGVITSAVSQSPLAFHTGSSSLKLLNAVTSASSPRSSKCGMPISGVSSANTIAMVSSAIHPLQQTYQRGHTQGVEIDYHLSGHQLTQPSCSGNVPTHTEGFDSGISNTSPETQSSTEFHLRQIGVETLSSASPFSSKLHHSNPMPAPASILKVSGTSNVGANKFQQFSTQLSSISSIQTPAQTAEEFKSRMSSIFCTIYMLILLIVATLLPLRLCFIDSKSFKWLMIFEIFYIFLYLVGIILLLFVYLRLVYSRTRSHNSRLPFFTFSNSKTKRFPTTKVSFFQRLRSRYLFNSVAIYSSPKHPINHGTSLPLRGHYSFNDSPRHLNPLLQTSTPLMLGSHPLPTVHHSRSRISGSSSGCSSSASAAHQNQTSFSLGGRGSLNRHTQALHAPGNLLEDSDPFAEDASTSAVHTSQQLLSPPFKGGVRKVSISPIQTTSVEVNPKNATGLLRDNDHEITFTGFTGNKGFSLRVGALCFGIISIFRDAMLLGLTFDATPPPEDHSIPIYGGGGSMDVDGHERRQQQPTLTTTDCHREFYYHEAMLRGIRASLSLVFSFIQLYLAFLNVKMNSKRYPGVLKFTLIHTLACNLCVWLRLALYDWRLAHPIAFSIHYGSTSSPEIASTSAPSTPYTMPNFPTPISTQGFMSNNSCEERSELGVIQRVASVADDYLGPCTVQFCLILSVLLWSACNKLMATNHFGTFNTHVSDSYCSLTKDGKSSAPSSTSVRRVTIEEMETRSASSQFNEYDPDAPYDLSTSSVTGITTTTTGATSSTHNTNSLCVQDVKNHDCSGAQKGLFSGLLILVSSMAGTIIYMVLLLHADNLQSRKYALRLIYSLSMTLNVAAAICTLLALLRMQELLQFSTKFYFLPRQMSHGLPRQQLLYFGVACHLAMILLSLLSPTAYNGSHEESWHRHYLVIAASLCALSQIVTMTLFLFFSSAAKCHKSIHLREKPGRNLITCLMFCNIALWLYDVLRPLHAFTVSPSVTSVPSPLPKMTSPILTPTTTPILSSWSSKQMTWFILERLVQPGVLFYRFYSLIRLLNIWCRVYSPLQHPPQQHRNGTSNT